MTQHRDLPSIPFVTVGNINNRGTRTRTVATVAITATLFGTAL